jgi:hypothetical protein
MGKSEARRQKQLAKKKAKRDDKRTQLARQTSDDPTIRLAAAETWPIVESLVPENLWDEGIGNLFIARRHPNGQIACAVFLVDTYCLGAKNAYWKIIAESEYADSVKKANRVGRLEKVSPEYFAKLVHDAVEYAQSLGFPPHPDYRHARALLQGIDMSLCADTFEFGKDGKPFYVNGPYDSPEKMKVIAHRVRAAGGDFVLMGAPSPEMLIPYAGEEKQLGVDESE